MTSFRKYGSAPFSLVLLHGGPGAAGELAPVARKLSEYTGVIEALQTIYSIEGLLEETRTIIKDHAQRPVILAGHSWGAWLGVLFTAKYPDLVRKLILVSSAPFEHKYSKQIIDTRMKRIGHKDRITLYKLLNRLKNNQFDSNSLFAEIGNILEAADICHSSGEKDEGIRYDYKMYESIWPLAVRLRDNGKLLESMAKINCPVTAVHGDYDAHPAEGVKKPLSENLKDFRFVLLKNCGHNPWKELLAMKEFFDILAKEILS